MRTVPIKNIGDPYTAVEFNELVSQELQNAVLSSDQLLDEFDEFQLGKALGLYAATGDFYTDSGVVNAYVLSPINIQHVPSAYIDGFRARFIATNTNSSSSTVNVNGLGVRSITENGIALVSGRIVAGKIIEITFNAFLDEFVFVAQHPNTSSVLDLTTTGPEVISTMTFDEFGHVENVFTRNMSPSDIGGVASVNAGTNITITGTATDPIINGAAGGGQVDSVVGGASITVNAADPVNPIVNADNSSTTAKGVAELATNGEVQAGVDTTRIVTASGLASIFSVQAGNPGFFRVTIGSLDFAVQFGEEFVLGDTTNTTLNLPIAFTNSDYGLAVTYETTGTGEQDNVNVNTKQAANFNFTNGQSANRLISWIACGFV